MDGDGKPGAAGIENFEASLSGTLKEECESTEVGVRAATEGGREGG